MATGETDVKSGRLSIMQILTFKIAILQIALMLAPHLNAAPLGICHQIHSKVSVDFRAMTTAKIMDRAPEIFSVLGVWRPGVPRASALVSWWQLPPDLPNAKRPSHVEVTRHEVRDAKTELSTYLIRGRWKPGHSDFLEHPEQKKAMSAYLQERGLSEPLDRYLLAAKEAERAFYNKEFDSSSRQTYWDYLNRSTIISIRDHLKQVVGSLRFVHVHYGRVILTDVERGVSRSIMGSAEAAYGIKRTSGHSGELEGIWQPSIEALRDAFDLNSQLRSLSRQKRASVQAETSRQAVESFLLPLERKFNIRLPRQPRERLSLGEIEHNGRKIRVEFEHGLAIEPGIFFIEKERRAAVFSEIAMWMARYLKTRPIPDFVPEVQIDYWTWNDTRMYVSFGFAAPNNLPLIKNEFQLYYGSPQNIQAKLTDMFDRRLKMLEDLDPRRAKGIQEFIEAYFLGNVPNTYDDWR